MSEEQPQCKEVIIMCERCHVNHADITIKMHFLSDCTHHPLVNLCASCFLIVFKTRKDIQYG